MRNLLKLKNRENQRGSVVVEFAIVLPLLLLLFIGITEFGIAYYNKQVITNASREGARAGIVALSEEETQGQKEERIKEIVHDYAKDRVITFGEDSFSIANNSVILEGCNETSDDYCKVSVEYEYTYIVLQLINFFGADFGTTLNIGASTTMRMEP